MFEPLTKKQKEIFDYINSYIQKNGYSPSLEEVKKTFNLKAISTVHEHINNLRKKGYITKEINQARGIDIRQETTIEQGVAKIPIIGKLINNKLMLTDSNSTFHFLDKSLINESHSFFSMIIGDNSYEEDFLLKGDILFIEKCEQLNNGDIILAETPENKQTVLRRYYKHDYIFKLEALGNKKKSKYYKSIKIIGIVRLKITHF